MLNIAVVRKGLMNPKRLRTVIESVDIMEMIIMITDNIVINCLQWDLKCFDSIIIRQPINGVSGNIKNDTIHSYI